MLLGVDVGGTHTDAVVLQNGKVIAKAKVLTDPHDLLKSIDQALGLVLLEIEPDSILHMNLSTTLSTNALIEKRIEEVAVVVSAGPGIDPEGFRVNNHYFAVGGAIDHCGVEVALLNESELRAIAAQCAKANVRMAAVVGKFSTRNPCHEERMAKVLAPHMTHITEGHRLSGHLNFPRRIATAYYNAAVWTLFNSFADAVEKSALRHGLTAPINILKADGGTIPLELARSLPVESILSGPAASVMGTIALSDQLLGPTTDALILDIGGTTTDIAVFVGGSPVVEEDGAVFAGAPTLVRAIKATSIGIGGDSLLKIEIAKSIDLPCPPEQTLRISVGPERLGPCMALGGNYPTLMDAFNYLELSNFGQIEASKDGLENLAKTHGLAPAALAKQAVEFALISIKNAITQVIDEINSKPVYTIRDLLGRRSIQPSRLFLMGGPAEAFKPLLADCLHMEIILPLQYSVANAIGAALARSTVELELFADTEYGKLLIPTLGLERKVDKEYTLEDAKQDALKAMRNYLDSQDIADDAPIDIIEATSFNMVNELGLAGRNIRVKCQIRPGLLGEVKC